MLNAWQHDQACGFTIFGHFIPAKKNNQSYQSGFRNLGTSECLSLAKCKCGLQRYVETSEATRENGVVKESTCSGSCQISMAHGYMLWMIHWTHKQVALFSVLYCSVVSTTVTQRSSKYVNVAIVSAVRHFSLRQISSCRRLWIDEVPHWMLLHVQKLRAILFRSYVWLDVPCLSFIRQHWQMD